MTFWPGACAVSRAAVCAGLAGSTPEDFVYFSDFPIAVSCSRNAGEMTPVTSTGVSQVMAPPSFTTFLVHSTACAAVLTAAIYLIIDLEFPRAGLIRIDAADQLLVDVRDSMR